MASVLKAISERLQSLGINYEFMEWNSDIAYPYFVGEYVESPIESEDGLQESAFILTGFTRGTWAELEESKDIIKKYFRHGISAITDSGSGVAVFYEGSHPIRVEDDDLKKIQINLTIKEWKVK